MADGVYLILDAKATKVLNQAGVRTAERPKERKGCVIFRAARHRGDENARTSGPHRCPRPYLYWVCAGEGQRQTSRVRPRDTHPRRKSAPDHHDHSVPGLPLEHVPLRRPERWLWQRNSRRRLPGQPGRLDRYAPRSRTRSVRLHRAAFGRGRAGHRTQDRGRRPEDLRRAGRRRLEHHRRERLQREARRDIEDGAACRTHVLLEGRADLYHLATGHIRRLREARHARSAVEDGAGNSGADDALPRTRFRPPWRGYGRRRESGGGTMSLWVVVVALLFGVFCSMTRNVIIKPEEVPELNDPQWTITSEPRR